MARASLDETWSTTLDRAAAGRAVHQVFSAGGWKLRGADDGVFEASQGSQVRMRALGGWFVGPQHMPKKATITLTGDGPVLVTAHIEEAMGFGVFDRRLRGKFEGYFAVWMAQARAALPPAR